MKDEVDFMNIVQGAVVCHELCSLLIQLKNFLFIVGTGMNKSWVLGHCDD